MQQATETAPTVQPPVAAPAQPGELTKDTYKGKIHPDWCPGCGDFSVLTPKRGFRGPAPTIAPSLQVVLLLH